MQMVSGKRYILIMAQRHEHGHDIFEGFDTYEEMIIHAASITKWATFNAAGNKKKYLETDMESIRKIHESVSKEPKYYRGATFFDSEGKDERCIPVSWAMWVIHTAYEKNRHGICQKYDPLKDKRFKKELIEKNAPEELLNVIPDTLYGNGKGGSISFVDRYRMIPTYELRGICEYADIWTKKHNEKHWYDKTKI